MLQSLGLQRVGHNLATELQEELIHLHLFLSCALRFNFIRTKALQSVKMLLYML